MRRMAAEYGYDDAPSEHILNEDDEVTRVAAEFGYDDYDDEHYHRSDEHEYDEEDYVQAAKYGIVLPPRKH